MHGDHLPVCVPGVPRERRLLPARRLALETEVARQRRDHDQDLFDRIKHRVSPFPRLLFVYYSVNLCTILKTIQQT